MSVAGALSELKVAELGGSLAGSYAAKLFADYGSEVILLDGNNQAAAAAFFDISKHSESNYEEHLVDADVVIQSSSVDGIEVPFQPRHSRQIVLRISPFGIEGPYKNWRSTDLVDAAISGHLRLTGDPKREPLNGVPDLVHLASGITGFIGALSALYVRSRTGHGQVVETSHQEVLAALHQFTLLRHTHNGSILGRLGNRYAGPGTPIGAYECSDGWIGLAVSQTDQMERMLEVTGLTGLLDKPGITSIVDLMSDQELVDSSLRPYLLAQKRHELVELFQALRIPIAPVSGMEDLLTDEHLAERDFWQTETREGLRLPGPPFRMSKHQWELAPKRVSGRSEDDREPLEGLVDGPLTGIRVLDMTRVWAGPLAARILADLGAEVLMTEVPWTRTPVNVPESYVKNTHFFPDDEAGDEPWNRSGFHNKYANNKLSAVIEIDKEKGRDLFAKLIAKSDVVIENYAPRVMPAFGLDENFLHSLNPDLVYVTMPGYGRDGPNRDWLAYGPTIAGHVGHTALTGYLDEGPWKNGIAWPDPIAGMHAAAAVIIALLDRKVQTDIQGQTIEVAQMETAINMIGHHLVASQFFGEQRRWGNRRPGRAPQGVYKCIGEDRWIAISIVDDHSWRALCNYASWHGLEDLVTAERWDRHDELDKKISDLASRHNDQELMFQLQEIGVPAGAVNDASNVMEDLNLDFNKFFSKLDHPQAGSHFWPRFACRLSLTPATMRAAAPSMGQHNHYAACDLAGLSDTEYEELVILKILRTKPPE